MCDERERAHEQEQHSPTVLAVSVQLARYSHKPEQPCCFQQANQISTLKKMFGFQS
jgi:hypothetical protein